MAGPREGLEGFSIDDFRISNKGQVMSNDECRMRGWRTMPRMAVVLALMLSGCLIAPLRVALPLEVTVVDAETNHPIPNANVVYTVHDIHNFTWDDVRFVRTISDAEGRVDIPGKRRWGIWFPAPGGLPVPDHFIAIWAAGYSAYVFSQYDSEKELRKRSSSRGEIQQALAEIPEDRKSSDGRLNPIGALIGGHIKLVKNE